MRGTGRIAAVAAAGLLLSGCGVPLDDRASPVPGHSRLTATSAPTSSRGEAVTVWYVADGQLVPRTVKAAGTSQAEALASLAAGTLDPRLRSLIVSPVDGSPLAVDPQPDPGSGAVRVRLSPTFAELSAADQVLLIGQVVLTLTETDRQPVLFVDEEGGVLSVPLPDGRLRDGAVTRGDYLPLT